MKPYSTLATNGSGSYTVEIRTGTSAGSVHGRHSSSHQTAIYNAPETQPLVSALRMSMSLSGMELFVDGIRRSYNMNGDTTSGITTQNLEIKNAGIFACLYPRTLSDTEIQQVTSWLTARYLT